MKKNHYQKKHSASNYKCKKCGWQFTEEGFWEKEHVDNCMKFIKPAEVPILPPIEDGIPTYIPDSLMRPGPDHPIWQDLLLQPYLPDAKEIILQHWDDIRQHFYDSSNIVQKYFFRVVGTDVSDFRMDDALRFIYSKLKNAFNFNIGMTYLLYRDEEDGSTEYMVFSAQKGMNDLFERNISVHNIETLKIALEKIDDLGDLVDNVERPDTKWRYVCALNFCYFIYIRPNFIAGKGHSHLPNYITQNKNVSTMQCDKSGNYFSDNLCFFRCLVKFFGGDYSDIEAVITLYEKYRRHVNGPFWKEFEGMIQEDIPIAECVFDINVQISRFLITGETIIVRKATNPNRPTVNMLMHML